MILSGMNFVEQMSLKQTKQYGNIATSSGSSLADVSLKQTKQYGNWLKYMRETVMISV